MAYMSKLAHRLARIRRLAGVMLVAAGLAYCNPAEPLNNSLESIPENDQAQLLRPSEVADLTVAVTSDSSVTLSFTEVDDGAGRPARYEVRYGESSVSSAQSAAVTSGTCSGALNGESIGAKRSCTVLGLKGGTGYGFQVVAYRGTANTDAVYGPVSKITPVTTQAAVASLTLEPAVVGVPAGHSTRIVATAKDAGGEVIPTRSVSWSSSDTTVATVDSDGLVTVQNAGSARIMADAGGTQAVASVKSAPLAAPITNPLAVTTLAAVSSTDTSVTLRFTEVDDGSGQPASYDIRYGLAPSQWWLSSSVTRGTCIVPIAGTAIGAQRTCVVYGLLPGRLYSFQIAAFRGTFGVDAVFGTISSAITYSTGAAVASVSVTPSPVSRTVGQTQQFTATPRDAAGNTLTGRTITWSSNNQAVATLNSSGLATAVAAGTATITAQAGTVSGQAALTVTSSTTTVTNPAAVSDFAAAGSTDSTISVTFTEVSDGAGGAASYDLRAGPAGNPWWRLTSVSRGSCVSPIAGTAVGTRRTCVIRGLSPSTSYNAQIVAFRGTFGVSAVFGPISNAVTIATAAGTSSVVASVASVAVTPASASLTVGQTQQLTATLRDASGNTLTGRVVTWSSSNSAAVSVNASGLATAVTSGSATITATSEGRTGTSAITSSLASAQPPPPPPPSDTGEPVDPGSGYAWADNFDRYESTQMMQACQPAVYGLRTTPNNSNCNNPVPSKYQLITGRSGGRALRSVYAPDPAHAQQTVSWLSPWGGTVNFGSSIVISVWVRIAPGQSYKPYGGKFWEAWWTSGDSRRIQWSNNGSLFEIALGANPGGTVNRTQQPVPPRWENINDGQWHRITMLFRANTSSTYRWLSGTRSATETYSGTSSRDGRVAMWVDGVKIIDYSQQTVNVVPAGGTGVWCRQGDVDMIPGLSGTNVIGGVKHFAFPEVANGTDAGMTIDHDDLKVWRY